MSQSVLEDEYEINGWKSWDKEIPKSGYAFISQWICQGLWYFVVFLNSKDGNIWDWNKYEKTWTVEEMSGTYWRYLE